jgi:hypothetical protein
MIHCQHDGAFSLTLYELWLVKAQVAYQDTDLIHYYTVLFGHCYFIMLKSFVTVG